MFMQPQVSPNFVVSQCFFLYTFYTFQFKFVYLVILSFYFEKFDKFVLFLNILTNYFTVSHCIVFLFCIYNFQTKSQFHVKWICRNKFIIVVIIMIVNIFSYWRQKSCFSQESKILENFELISYYTVSLKDLIMLLGSLASKECSPHFFMRTCFIRTLRVRLPKN